MQWSGSRDKAEEEEWQSRVAPPHGLFELVQDGPTFRSGACRSRLDRVYVNQPTADQLDRRIGCAALEWVPPYFGS